MNCEVIEAFPISEQLEKAKEFKRWRREAFETPTILLDFKNKNITPEIMTMQVRKLLMLGIFLASGFAAVHFRGRQRAYWGSFFITMLLLSISSAHIKVIPNLYLLADAISPNPDLFKTSTQQVVHLVRYTIMDGITLLFATLMGFISAWIYEHAKRTSNGRPTTTTD